MKVVLDTNILISAFVFPGGKPEAVYRMAVEGRVELTSSVVILAEFGRVLTEKFGRDDRAVAEAVAQVAVIAMVTTPSEVVHVIEADPDDDRILEAAAEGGAGVIVSGDRHLLQLREWRGIRILSPAEVLSEFQ